MPPPEIAEKPGANDDAAGADDYPRAMIMVSEKELVAISRRAAGARVAARHHAHPSPSMREDVGCGGGGPKGYKWSPTRDRGLRLAGVHVLCLC